MAIPKLDRQTQTSATQLVPLLVTAEATTQHEINEPVALTEEHPAHGTRSIQTEKGKHKNQPLSFCPTCNMLLRATASYPSTLRCKKCGYKSIFDQAVVFESRQSYQKNEIAVLDKEEGRLRTFPIVQANCERCGKTESETWTVAVGSEGSISAWVFLRCVHCGFTRREVG